MIDGLKVLAIIPARGGSKGVQHKNIRHVAGKPLIAWTIEEAKKSRFIDRVIVSTDDPSIADVALQWGAEVPFLRPAEFARDDSPGIAPVLHAIETLQQQYDLVVLLQPTSPLRTVEDIDGCIGHLQEYRAKSCVSVVEPDKSPYWMYRFTAEKRLEPLFETAFDRRQDLPETYALNGAVYVAECGWLMKTKSFMSKETSGYIMPKERSLDIDSELDIKICNYLKSEAV